jgi:hypothetical protein
MFYPTSFGQTITTSVKIAAPFVGAQNTQVRVSAFFMLSPQMRY